jgi:hypothetical protein
MTFFKAPLFDCPRAEPGAPPTLGQLGKKGFYAPHEAKGNHSLTGISLPTFRESRCGAENLSIGTGNRLASYPAF